MSDYISDIIIEREGNLVRGNFKPRPQASLRKKDGGPLATVAITTVIAPVLIASAAAPFLDDNTHDKSDDQSQPSHELRLPILPEHMRVPTSALIQKFGEKSGKEHACKIEQEDSNGKQR